MERMHGIDAFAVYSETPTSPFVTLKVAVYRPVDGNDRPSPDELCVGLGRQIVRVGAGVADRRIVRVPGDLHHPVWVHDPAFDPTRHVQRASLPAPGGKAELCEFLSDLMGRPLDATRPPWEIWVVDGLEGGRIAVAAKVHHALADGKTTARLIVEAHQPDDGSHPWPGADAGDPPARPEPSSIPGPVRLVRDGLVDLVATFTDELPAFVRNVRRIRRERHLSDIEIEPDTVDRGPVPHTVLNGFGGPHRIYRYETFSLAGMKRLARSYDCTLNTLLLGICSEALRRYLSEVDTVPATSLVASMPVGDPEGPVHATRLHTEPPHNSIAAPRLPLHQNIDDFEMRLQAIARSSHAAIGAVHRSFGHRFDNLLEFLPGSVVRRVFAVMERRERQGKQPFSNVVISNVPGPRTPLRTLDGRLEMEELLSTGNIADLGHLNITAWSYADNFAISFYMREGALPEPERIPAAVREVVTELEDRLAGATPAAR